MPPQHKARLCPGLRAGAVCLPGLEINRKLFSINYLVLTFQRWPDGDEGGTVDVNTESTIVCNKWLIHSYMKSCRSIIIHCAFPESTWPHTLGYELPERMKIFVHETTSLGCQGNAFWQYMSYCWHSCHFRQLHITVLLKCLLSYIMTAVRTTIKAIAYLMWGPNVFSH